MDESVHIAPYNPEWQLWYQEEATYVHQLFGNTQLTLEHYGSTAVQGLAAKPIIGILAGFSSLPLTPTDYDHLAHGGYQLSKQFEDRTYWRKSTEHQFTLAAVQFESESWFDHIAVRDYLRIHPEQATAYAAIKYQAIAHNKSSIDAYRLHKKPFLDDLFFRAKQWQRSRQ